MPTENLGQEVAPGIYRLGTEWVNWFLVEQDGSFTVVDTGFAGYFDQLEQVLRDRGATMDQIAAIVLTHTHVDHIGCAERIRSMSGAPVFIHPDDEAVLTGKAKGKQPDGFFANLWRPYLLKFLVHALGAGGTKMPTVKAGVTTVSDGQVLDVPGKPLVVATPGHSPGHCSIVFQDRDAVVTGDAMATLNVTNGERGPRLHPFNEDRTRAVQSLGVLEGLTVSNLLPGHGEPWSGSMADAVATAREGIS